MGLGLSRTRAAKAAPADPAAGALRPEEIARIAAAIELIPVPLALVGCVEGGVLVEAANRAFRVAGLGNTGRDAPLIGALGERITAFLCGEAAQEDFAWEFGDAVDCRHFMVTLARRTSQSDHCFITLVDRTGELRTARNLRREMITDSLTGLPNRSGFSELLEERIVGNGDTSGERFAVLLSQATPDQAELLCQRVVRTLSEASGAGPRITVSAGVSRIEGTLDDTLKRADAAVVVAKAKGRNRLEMEAGLPRHLLAGEFSIHR